MHKPCDWPLIGVLNAPSANALSSSGPSQHYSTQTETHMQASMCLLVLQLPGGIAKPCHQCPTCCSAASSSRPGLPAGMPDGDMASRIPAAFRGHECSSPQSRVPALAPTRPTEEIIAMSAEADDASSTLIHPLWRPDQLAIGSLRRCLAPDPFSLYPTPIWLHGPWTLAPPAAAVAFPLLPRSRPRCRQWMKGYFGRRWRRAVPRAFVRLWFHALYGCRPERGAARLQGARREGNHYFRPPRSPSRLTGRLSQNVVPAHGGVGAAPQGRRVFSASRRRDVAVVSRRDVSPAHDTGET
nr:unnamed protein product [Digitaria exilis]